MTEETIKLAKKIKKVLDANPEATVREIAAEVEAEPGEVEAIIDSHVVDEHGKISHAGEGQGGGWVPPPESEEDEPES